MSENKKFVQGNEACIEGALYAGLDFYAGYPITPSSEIAEIFPEVEEDLGRLEIEDPNLNRLREKILSLLGEDSSLDIDDLNSHLIKAGFDSELSMVLSRSVRTHAGFIKKENSQDIVLEGWREITSFLNSKNMRKELLDASRELAENFCKEKEDKVLALHDVHNATDN